MPMLAADYAFFGDENEPLITVRVVSIRPYGVVFATVVEKTGSHPTVVKQLATWMQEADLVQCVYRTEDVAHSPGYH